MKRRTRYTVLAVFILVAGVLAAGAWHDSPGQDPDNQAGYLIVILLFLALLFIYVPLGMRSIGSRLGRGDSRSSG